MKFAKGNFAISVKDTRPKEEAWRYGHEAEQHDRQINERFELAKCGLRTGQMSAVQEIRSGVFAISGAERRGRNPVLGYSRPTPAWQKA